MKKSIIRIATLILTLALIASVTVIPAFAAEVEPPVVEAPTSNIEIVSALTAELHADNEEEYTVNTETAEVTEIDFIPLYAQTDYDIPYGTYGNVASGGCGLVSVWMVASYYNNETYDIEDLTAEFGSYHVRNAGSAWSLFMGTADPSLLSDEQMAIVNRQNPKGNGENSLNLPMVLSDAPHGEWYDWDMVVEALENGQPVICLQRKGIFTGGGHFIVLTGITEDGKILVNDPNGRNWTKNSTMIEGFANGFTQQQIRAGACAYWIYAAKEEEPPVEIFKNPAIKMPLQYDIMMAD